MESNKALSADQLSNLKEIVRQRFDDLYHRVGSNRQNLMNKVLSEHHQINKEFAKEKIDEDREKEILRKVREIERAANSQLPLVHKVVAPSTPTSSPTTPPLKVEKPAKESKPNELPKAKESKPKPKEAKAKPKATKPTTSKAKASKSKPAKKKKK
jgi:hypothetical protein